jgi:hypothetical protein
MSFTKIHICDCQVIKVYIMSFAVDKKILRSSEIFAALAQCSKMLAVLHHRVSLLLPGNAPRTRLPDTVVQT